MDHLRHSYNPLNSVLVKLPAGHWEAKPVTPGARTEQGIAIYRFGTSLYYANAARLVDDLRLLVGTGEPLNWLVLDLAAVADVDFTAAAVLTTALGIAKDLHLRFAQRRPRPGAAGTRPLRHHQGAGLRCQLRDRGCGA